MPPAQDVEPRAFSFQGSKPHYSITPMDGDQYSFTVCHCLIGKNHPWDRDARTARTSRDPAHISTIVLESLKGMAERREEKARSQTKDAEAIRHVMDLVKQESSDG